MRKRMESERIRRDEDNRDIKFGIGGIVDIEFIIQLLQLKYGGSIKELRGTGSLETLKLLSREKLISEEDYQILSKCYLFLRGIEGRLRVEHDRPVTAIPGSKDELSLLAKKLGYKDNRDSAGDKFYKDLKSNTEYVREVYNRMFGIG
mgnify:FL=1